MAPRGPEGRVLLSGAPSSSEGLSEKWGPCSLGSSGDSHSPRHPRGSGVVHSVEKARDAGPSWSWAAGLARLVGGGWDGTFQPTLSPGLACLLELELLAGWGGAGAQHAPRMLACFPWDLGGTALAPHPCVVPCSDVAACKGAEGGVGPRWQGCTRQLPPAAAVAALRPALAALGHLESFPLGCWGDGRGAARALCPLLTSG